MAAPELPPGPSERGPSGITFEQAQAEIQRQSGGATPNRNDPAFAPPGDPARLPGAKAKAQVIERDIPLLTVQNAWAVDQARNALAGHMAGVFEWSAQLADSILGDDRVMATLGSRRAGLFGREVRFKPANDSRAAKEVLDAWVEHWPQLSGDSSLGILNDYEILMGFADAQLVWDTTGDIWKPYLRFWHARYEYYHWNLRRFMAITQDGQVPIIAGDGKWVHHSRFGEYRCWIRGAIRAVTEPFLVRHFALRDWARYSEKHGLPIVVAEAPMAADAAERSQFGHQVANLGNESTILMGKGVDKDNSYDIRLVEATDNAWEAFPGLRDHCDMAIVLALLFQNLTTEVKGGSFAATNAHMDIRDSGIQDDNAAWRNTLRGQVARPFALFNFGDPALAPWTEWDVASRSQYEANAKQFQAVGTGIEVARRGGVQFKDPEEVRQWCAKRFGLDGLPDFKITDPVASGMGGQKGSKLPFTPVDPAAVVKVNEARQLNDLPAIPGGDVTIQEFHADKDASRDKDVTEASEKAKADNKPDSPSPAPPGGDDGGDDA